MSGSAQSLSALFMQNPELAIALRRREEAQPLIRAGTSTEPVASPWQGIARLAQALLGGYESRKADEASTDLISRDRAANDQRAKQLAALMGGAPLPGEQGAGQPAAQPSLAGFERQLAGAESGGRPDIVNSQGYSGMFQYGTGRLAALGLYQPGQGEDLKANQWRGQFNIPGFPQVKTHADFLANPAAQQAVNRLDVASIDQAIAGTPGADRFDRSGLRAVAHLGGVEGMRRFVQTGGQYNPSDANGTSLSLYYKKFSGQGGAPAGGAPGASIAEMERRIALIRGLGAGDPAALAHAAMLEARMKRDIEQQHYMRGRTDTVADRQAAWAREDANRIPPTLQIAGPDGRPQIVQQTPTGTGAVIGTPPSPPVGGADQQAIFQIGEKIENGTATQQDRLSLLAALVAKETGSTGANGVVIPGKPLLRHELAWRAEAERGLKPVQTPLANPAAQPPPGSPPQPAPDAVPPAYRPMPGNPGAVQAPPVPPPPEKVMTGMLENAAAVKKIDATLGELDKRGGQGVGLAAALLPDMIMQRTDPAGVDLRALIADIGSLKIHDRSGAAVTVAEYPRLKPFIPTVGDTPETVRKKLAQFRTEYMTIIQDNYRSFGPEAGGRPVPVIEEVMRGQTSRPGDAAPTRGGEAPEGTVIVGPDGREQVKKGGKWVSP